MTRRFLISIGSLVIPIAAVSLLTIPVSGQTRAAAKSNATAAKAYTPPKTADGQPDLQGFWTNSTYTPLERPDGVTKEFFTPEEAAVVEKAAAAREAEQTEPGTVADVHYDFTQFGLDRSQSTFAHNLRTSQIIDPPNGKIPPLNAEGQKRAAERAAARKAMGGPYDAIQNMPIGSRCIIMGGAGPPMQNTGYNNNFQIVQSPGYVMLLVEMIHDARVIPLDGRPQPPSGIRQWMGVSRGRWEGNTLVVETTNFNGKNPFRGTSENVKITERFMRVADNQMVYRFTVEDPSTWDKPWTAEMNVAKTEGPMFEHACHEGNYSVANILAGARIEEKKAAEGAAKKAETK
jgi:hypothetical protein